MSNFPLPKGCVCDPLNEEWLSGPRREVCSAPMFTVLPGVDPQPSDQCGRCEHDRACHSFDDPDEATTPVLYTEHTILSADELLAETWSKFDEVFGAKQ